MTTSPSATRLATFGRLPVVLVVAVFLAAAVALLLIVMVGAPTISLFVAPLVAAAAVLLLWNTHWGLCFAAFAIAPLNVVQYEILDVTVNLPEVVILALALKEIARLFLRKERFTARFPLPAVGLYLFAALVAVGTGFVYGNDTIRVLQDFRQFNEFVLLFWLVLQRVSGRRQVAQLATCYVLGVVLVAIHGLAQHFAPAGLPKAVADALMLYGRRRSGSFYGATTLGGLIVLGVGPALGLIAASRRLVYRLLLLLGIILCLAAAVYTGTRASFAAIALAAIIFGLAVRPSAKIVAAIGLAAVIFAAALVTVSLDRVARLRDPLTDRSLMERAAYYTTAAHIFRAHPVLGLGWGAYYDVNAIVSAHEYVATPRPQGAPNATVHSAYLQILVKSGALGLLSFLAVLFAWLARTWRAARTPEKDERYFALLAGLTGGVGGYLFHSALENFFQWPVMAQSFWLLLGLCFVASHEMAHGRRCLRAPLVFLAGAMAVLALFFGVALHLQMTSPFYYRENIAAAMAAGKWDRAIQISQKAAHAYPLDPMTHTLYGRLLIREGHAEEGVEKLLEAVSLGVMEPGTPPRIPDRRAPYYFAPARLSLGAHYLAQGQPEVALEHFELARADAELTDSTYQEFHPALYTAYAQLGLWARALDFAQPTDEELERLSSVQLGELAGVAEGRNNWELAERVGYQLQNREDASAAAHYLFGRAAANRKEWETAADHLRQALASGHDRAAYFLAGTLLEQGATRDALDAFLDVPADSFYRPFALAQAASLAAAAPGETPASPQELLDELEARIDALAPIVLPRASTKRYTPVAMRPIGRQPRSGAALPVLMRWKDNQPDSSDEATAFSFTSTPESVLLHRNGEVIQLQWLENIVGWVNVKHLPLGAQPIPGSIGTAYEWFRIRSHPVVQVEEDPPGDAFLGFEEPTWFYSVPEVVRDSDWFLFASRVRNPEGKALLGLQAMDEDERVLSEIDLFNADPEPQWIRRAAAVPGKTSWHALRVYLTVLPRPGVAAIDDVVLLSLPQPALEVSTTE